MIKIAICDDEIYQLNKTYEMILDIGKKHNIDIDIHTFDSSKTLINFLYDNFIFFDLYFLDIVMDDINGLELAKFIRNNNNFCEIIFTTTSREYVLEGYEIDASNYLLKPLDFNKLESQLLKSINNIITILNDSIVIKNGSFLKKILLCNIVFFESKLRKVIINTFTKESFDFYEKLESINGIVSKKNFIKCHKSYIVNLRYIKEIKDNNIITSTNDIIPISRSYLKSTKDSFMSYFMEDL